MKKHSHITVVAAGISDKRKEPTYEAITTTAEAVQKQNGSGPKSGQHEQLQATTPNNAKGDSLQQRRQLHQLHRTNGNVARPHSSAAAAAVAPSIKVDKCPDEKLKNGQAPPAAVLEQRRNKSPGKCF